MEQGKVILILLAACLLAAVCILAAKLYTTDKQLKTARRKNEEKDRYLVTVSHEIRTPLNGIIGMQYLMRQNMEDPDRLKSYLDKLEVSSEYLKTLVSEVLDMSKIESGQMELLKESLDLRELLDEVRLLIQIQVERKMLKFSTDIRLEESFIIGDSVRIKQILINLLGNAVKFTNTGGTIVLSVRQDRNGNDTGIIKTIFTVEDNGKGMGREFLKKIWKPFEQEEGSTQPNGTGLGTTLSKSLAEQMGGRIGVESTAGVGTVFTVSIPAHIGQESAETTVEMCSAGVTQQHIVPGKILVAEDNEISREIACEILRVGGYETLEASDGEEAVRIFRESRPEDIGAILMDIQMPKMDGYEATRQIRAMDRADAAKVKIIALTANAFKEQLELAGASGMDYTVTKPLDVEQLMLLLIHLSPEINGS